MKLNFFMILTLLFANIKSSASIPICKDTGKNTLESNKNFSLIEVKNESTFPVNVRIYPLQWGSYLHYIPIDEPKGHTPILHMHYEHLCGNNSQCSVGNSDDTGYKRVQTYLISDDSFKGNLFMPQKLDITLSLERKSETENLIKGTECFNNNDCQEDKQLSEIRNIMQKIHNNETEDLSFESLFCIFEGNYFIKNIIMDATIDSCFNFLGKLKNIENNFYRNNLDKSLRGLSYEKFLQSYSSINFFPENCPFLTCFPGLISLKTFILNKIIGVPLEERNLFSIFYGIKMIVSYAKANKNQLSNFISDDKQKNEQPNRFKFNQVGLYKVSHNFIIFLKIIEFFLIENNLCDNFFKEKINFVIDGCLYIKKDTFISQEMTNVFLYSAIDLFFNINDELYRLIMKKYEIVSINLKFYKGTFYDHKRYIFLKNIEKDIIILSFKAYCEIFESGSFLDISRVDKSKNSEFIAYLKKMTKNIARNDNKIQKEEFLETIFTDCILHLHYNIKCIHNYDIPNKYYIEAFNTIYTERFLKIRNKI